MTPWMQLASGAPYDIGAASCPEIDFNLDIVMPLSRICRYLGHTSEPWSVAAHAVCCSRFARAKRWGARIEFLALHHDDHEALMGDIPSPMKRFLGSDSLRYIEAATEVAVRTCVGIPEQIDPEIAALVKRIDLALLMGEAEVLMAPPPRPWGIEVSDEDRDLAACLVEEAIEIREGFGYNAAASYRVIDRSLRMAMA